MSKARRGRYTIALCYTSVDEPLAFSVRSAGVAGRVALAGRLARAIAHVPHAVSVGVTLVGGAMEKLAPHLAA